MKLWGKKHLQQEHFLYGLDNELKWRGERGDIFESLKKTHERLKLSSEDLNPGSAQKTAMEMLLEQNTANG